MAYTYTMNPQFVGRRLVIAHNPHSSRAGRVQAAVFDRLDKAGYRYTRLEIQRGSLQENVAYLVPLIQPGDVILSAAGDGSAHALAHAVLEANQVDISLGFLGFGNFNDLAHTFGTRASLRDPLELLKDAKEVQLRPLDVIANGRLQRKAFLYATFGWTAQAASRYDNPGIRRRLQSGEVGVIRNMWRMTGYYFRSRASSLLPTSFDESAERQPLITDLLCVNGPSVARLFRSGKKWYSASEFLLVRLDVRRLLPNTFFLLLSLCGRMPGVKTTVMKRTFEEPAHIPMQCDGEVVELIAVESLEVRKSSRSLTVLSMK